MREVWKVKKAEGVCSGGYAVCCVQDAYAEWSLERYSVTAAALSAKDVGR